MLGYRELNQELIKDQNNQNERSNKPFSNIDLNNFDENGGISLEESLFELKLVYLQKVFPQLMESWKVNMWCSSLKLPVQVQITKRVVNNSGDTNTNPSLENENNIGGVVNARTELSEIPKTHHSPEIDTIYYNVIKLLQNQLTIF